MSDKRYQDLTIVSGCCYSRFVISTSNLMMETSKNISAIFKWYKESHRRRQSALVKNFTFKIALIWINSLCSYDISSWISRAVLLTTKQKVAFTNFNGCTREQLGMWRVEPVLKQSTIKVVRAPLNTLSRNWSVT